MGGKPHSHLLWGLHADGHGSLAGFLAGQLSSESHAAKGGAQEHGVPSRPAHPSACPQHPRNPLSLSQPSLQTLLLVAQMCVSAALRTPQFLEVLFCATSGTSAPSPIQKHHVGHAISGRAASPACSEGDLPVQLTLLIFLVFGLPGSDFFARKTAGTSTHCLHPQVEGWVCERTGLLSQALPLFCGSEVGSVCMCAQKNGSLWSLLWLSSVSVHGRQVLRVF